MPEFSFDPIEHIYRLNGAIIPSVSEIISSMGLADYSKVNQKALEAGRQFGSAFHKATELWDNNTLDIDTLSPPLIPLLEAWKEFKNDYRIGKFIENEKQVYSKKWGFAGTLDRIFKYAGRNILIDIKTSSAIYSSVGLQLSAYQIAYEEMENIKIDKRWAVKFSMDGEYSVIPFTNKSDRQTFLSALNIYVWKKNVDNSR